MKRFVEDAAMETRFDRVSQHEIHSAPEQSLQEVPQIHIGVEGLRFEVHDEIDVAALVCRAVRVRSEQTQPPDAESTDRVSVLFERSEDFLGGAHVSSYRRSLEDASSSFGRSPSSPKGAGSRLPALEIALRYLVRSDEIISVARSRSAAREARPLKRVVR